MKNLAITLIGVSAFVVIIFGLANWSNNKTADIHGKMGTTTLPNGDRIFEVVHNGSTYVVIEKHNGIGICKK